MTCTDGTGMVTERPRLFCMSEWSEQTVARIAASIRKRRTELKLSAQELADRTKELGHPVNRSSIAGWENGTRGDRMLIGDVLVLCEALRMPLGALLYPEQPDGEVEVYPGVSFGSYEAAQSLTGEVVIPRPGDLTPGDDGIELGSQRLDDWTTGTELPRLVRMRAALHGLHETAHREYEDALADGNVESAQHRLTYMDDLSRRLRRITSEIRKLGGVVNDE